MKSLRILFVLLFFLLAGCKIVQFQNGEVPAEYLPQVQKYVGTYKGYFENQKGVLKIVLNGNKPSLTFLSNDGSIDILDVSCQSKIGMIDSAEVDTQDNQPVVQIIGFQFDGGQCPVLGNDIELYPGLKNGKLKFYVRILDKYIRVGTIKHPDYEPYYFTGEFYQE